MNPDKILEDDQIRRSMMLSRSAIDVIRGNLSELKRNLPYPGVIWRWTESPLDKSVQWRLRENGIYEVHSGWYRTSEQLWCYVLEESAEDEEVGVRIGQVPLFAPGDEPIPGRSESRLNSGDASAEPEPRQMSLDGKDVTDVVKKVRKERDVSMNELGKRGGEATARKRKGEPPDIEEDQLTLEAFTDDDEEKEVEDRFRSPPDLLSSDHADVAV